MQPFWKYIRQMLNSSIADTLQKSFYLETVIVSVKK